MYSPATVNRPSRLPPPTISQNPIKTTHHNQFLHTLSKPLSSSSYYYSSSSKPIQFHHKSYKVQTSSRRLFLKPRVLSDDTQPTLPFITSDEASEPSFLEFITSERVKVVAMVALALALCNADRVVMSVAIVPLSQSRGWSQAFAGVVQSSFLWGYLISPIAGGTLVDYYGGKIVMACGVALWSV